MTKLFTFIPSRFPGLEKAALEAVSASCLFYLHNGRNAWHSTWVQQYAEGCMHSDERSAKESAERQRTQGSVFYISQIPALLFRTPNGCLAVTEINTTQPLSGYSPDAVLKSSPSGTPLIEGARDCYIEKGAPILGVVRSFDLSSRFWSRRPSPRNSVIVVGTEDPTTAFAPVAQSVPTTIRSYSNGKNYMLGWNQINRSGKAEPGFISTIAARFLS
jgi:hypothetical protein